MSDNVIQFPGSKDTPETQAQEPDITINIQVTPKATFPWGPLFLCVFAIGCVILDFALG